MVRESQEKPGYQYNLVMIIVMIMISDTKIFPSYEAKQSKANQCEFGEISNRLINDMLVCGLHVYALRERERERERERKRMLQEIDLSLEKVIKVGESGEEMRRETELMTKTLETENIDSVQKRGRNGEN